MKIKTWIFALILVAALPALAADSDGATHRSTSPTASGNGGTGIAWNGWGLRAGMASDADQVLFGAQCNCGEFARNVRFQPDLEVGSGDDVTTVYATVPVYYRFRTAASGMTPYAGGGPAMGYVDVDSPALSGDDDSSFEVGARATGGLEWARRGGSAFAVELSLGFGDVHDARFVAAWQF